MLQNVLKRKNISIYRLAKETNLSYSTINYIVNGRTSIENCNVETFRKIADFLNMTMDELYNECQYVGDDFEVFKSNVGHYLRETGELNFIEEYLLSEEIETLWNSGNKLQALYLIAMVDYLSRINEIPLCDKFSKYREYKLKTPVYSSSYYVHKAVVPSYEAKNVIPEFERFGIMEGEIFYVR